MQRISQASARRANTDDLKVTYQRKSKLTVEATCAAAAAAAALHPNIDHAHRRLREAKAANPRLRRLLEG